MKFSIITPSFNQPEWLRLCLASVADQRSESGESGAKNIPEFTVEHLVQDGGSTDGSLDLLRQWSLENPALAAGQSGHYSFGYFSEADQGMYDAINRGLKKSTGDICAWLNCDEQYLPGALAKVDRFFYENPGIDMVFGDALLVDAEGRALSYRKAVLPDPVHTRLVHLNTLSCATFFRRNLVERGFLFETKWRAIGDAVWIHSLLKAGVAMAVMDEPLAVFAFTGANQSASEGARREALAWSGAKDAPPGWLRWPAILRHRLAKWRGGAYRKRNFSYETWTAGSTARIRREARELGWGWPE